MSQAARDQNHVASALGVSSSDSTLTLPFLVDPITGRLLTDQSGGGTGDVVGPASSTDNAVVRFDGTTGKLIQNSVVTIADTTGNMAGVGTINTLTLPASNFVGISDSQTLTNKTINGANNTLTVRLASDVTGNLPVTNLNSGTSASGTTFWRGDGTWATPSGSGDVVGPSSATNNAIARFDTTTGKLIKNSAVTVADTTGVIAGTQGVTISGSSSGSVLIKVPAAAGSNTLTFPAGTTDFSATGGTSQVVKQTTSGGALTVAQLAASDLSNGTTGSGAVVLATSPTLVTPTLGVATATSINGLTVTTSTGTLTITNLKTLSVSNTLTFTGTDGSSVNFGAGGTVLYGNQTITLTGDVTGSGATSIATTLATVNSNVGTFGSATQASVVTVNAKGLVTAASNTTVTPAVGSITGLGTGVATFLATPSSANLAAAVTDETGTGALVFATSPTFTTSLISPKVVGGTGTTGTQLTLQTTSGNGTTDALVITGGNNGATTFATFSNAALSLGTSATFTTGTIELGAATDTTLSRSSAGVLAVEGVVIPSISSTNTLTNKRWTRRLTTTSGPGATPTTNTDNVDIMNFTALATAITSMTTNLSGTPVDGDKLEFRFTDNGTARAITWGSSFQSTTVTLPTTTVISTMLRVGFEWNNGATKWDCIATA